MITDEDIQMSKMSYVNKDFGTIYPQLLDLAKQLTNKWDPSMSNESDPGVVLLKEGAFIADHTNYNIDKNILEAFLPSATQQNSVTNIVEMNGYAPRYYIAATGDITFTYVADSDETFSPFNIPAFTMLVSDEDESITYTQISALSVSENKSATSCTFIEGTLNTLTIDGSTTILLENLDEDKRIYFPVTYIAQNGVYVSTIDDPSDYWERKDYLLASPLKSKIYKVGYNSQKGLPYIEFPSDIATIIGNGLQIKYITTTGASGNVSANTLTNIVSSTTYTSGDTTIDLSKLSLNNYSSINNGKDPETIDEMYNSFQKIVGTFDTLVTRQDYQNAIDELTNTLTGENLVSKSLVTDITTDYNYALKITSFDQYGTYIADSAKASNNIEFYASKPSDPKTGSIYFDSTSSTFQYYNGNEWKAISKLSYDEFMNGTQTMTPYDLYIYALKMYNSNEYSSSRPFIALDNSYNSADEDTTIAEVETDLEELKCINHTFKTAKVGDILYFKNYTPLYVTITPYSKVTKQEKDDIVNSVYKALSNNFNAHSLAFGEELSYDNIVNVLLNADDRIKNIRLEDLTYRPYAVRKTQTGTEDLDLYDTANTELLVDLIAKNVLAGRLCLFDFDDTFTYEYGQQSASEESAAVITDDVTTISTEVTLTPTVNENPSSSTSQTVTYNFSKSTSNIQVTLSGGSGTKTIAAGQSYTLVSGESLFVKWNIDTAYPDAADSYTYAYTSDNNTYKVTAQDADITLTYGAASELTPTAITVSNVVIGTTASDNSIVYPTLLENEYIHIAYQSYATDVIYPTYVNYRFVSSIDGAQIPKNVDYVLQGGEHLYLNYTSSGVESTQEYGVGDVIKSTLNIEPTSEGTYKTWTDSYGRESTAVFATLGANDQIEHRKLMQTILDGHTVPCYWIRNNVNNNLFPETGEFGATAGTYSTILGSDEYFIYSNENRDMLTILGSGTKLSTYISADQLSEWSLTGDGYDISIQSISEDGYSSGINFIIKDFSTYNFYMNEQTVVTLGTGDTLTIYDWTADDKQLDNTWKSCTGSIKYTLSDGTTTELGKAQAGNYWLRTRLDIAMSQTSGQTLTSASGQRSEIITVTTDAGSSSSLENCIVKASQKITAYGDSELDIDRILNTTISVESYKSADCILVENEEQSILTATNGKISVVVDKNLSATLPFFYRLSSTDVTRRCILPIYVTADQLFTTSINVKVTETSDGTAWNIAEFNSGNTSTASINLTSSGMYLLELDNQEGEIANLTLTLTVSNYNSNDALVVTFYRPVIETGLNSNLQYGDVTLDAVLSDMKNLVSDSTKSTLKPYYINTPESSIAIQDDDISNANIFWDKNNIANPLTIPYINLHPTESGGSNIDIIKSMRNYT